jgi:hypothetical protein
MSVTRRLFEPGRPSAHVTKSVVIFQLRASPALVPKMASREEDPRRWAQRADLAGVSAFG